MREVAGLILVAAAWLAAWPAAASDAPLPEGCHWAQQSSPRPLRKRQAAAPRPDGAQPRAPTRRVKRPVAPRVMVCPDKPRSPLLPPPEPPARIGFGPDPGPGPMDVPPPPAIVSPPAPMATPEPSALLLVGLGLVGVAAARRARG
jgi:hypothetical protein